MTEMIFWIVFVVAIVGFVVSGLWARNHECQECKRMGRNCTLHTGEPRE